MNASKFDTQAESTIGITYLHSIGKGLLFRYSWKIVTWLIISTILARTWTDINGKLFRKKIILLNIF